MEWTLGEGPIDRQAVSRVGAGPAAEADTPVRAPGRPALVSRFIRARARCFLL